MGKMSDRRRKAKKQKNKKAKMLKSLQLPKIRVPIPPVGSAFKSPKDYNRSENKKIIQKELLDE